MIRAIEDGHYHHRDWIVHWIANEAGGNDIWITDRDGEPIWSYRECQKLTKAIDLCCGAIDSVLNSTGKQRFFNIFDSDSYYVNRLSEQIRRTDEAPDEPEEPEFLDL